MEQHEVLKRREILNKYLDKLTQSDSEMYYATTSQVSRALHEMIHDDHQHLPPEEQMLVKRLSIAEIDMILSFNE